MPMNDMTRYAKARYEAPQRITQEQAAELLFVSLRTVKDWEGGGRVPSPEVVARMSEVYNAPWLCLDYAQEVLQELGIFPDGCCITTLQTAVLTMDDCVHRLMDIYRRLIQIAADGQTDESEEADFQAITRIISEVVVAGLQVIYHYETEGIKKDRSGVGAPKRSGVMTSTKTSTTMNKYSLTNSECLSRPNLFQTGG